MKQKKVKMLKWGTLLTVTVLAVIISSVLIFRTFNNTKHHPENIPSDEKCLATINGEKILKREIDLVYRQFEDSEIEYEEILNNSIDEVLVIQKAKDFKIEVSNSEVESRIQEYKEMYPDLYNEAVDIYGVKELYKGQRNRIIYNKVKAYVMSNIIGEDISDRTVSDFIDKYNLKSQLEDYTTAQIKSSLHSELEEYLFENWIEDIKKEADIVIY